MKPPPSPSVSLSAADMRAGALLAQALVQLAAEHARERGASDSVVIAALASALGLVAASVTRTNGYNPADFQAFVANHFTYAFDCESRGRVYH